MDGSPMHTRRSFLAALAAGTVAALAWRHPVALAAQPTVEIIALPHWPVRDALKPVRSYLAKLKGRVRVIELDAESPEGEKRLRALGLKGHIPILLLIDGSYRFKRGDGSAVELKDFPAKAANPLGLNGTWTVADFEALVAARLSQGGKQP
jgi:hypothetical protein